MLKPKHVLQSLVLMSLVSVLVMSQQSEQAVRIVQREDMLIPESSLERPADVGKGLKAHTNTVLLANPAGVNPAVERDAAIQPETTGLLPYGENPLSIRAIYKLPSTGGAGMIA